MSNNTVKHKHDMLIVYFNKKQTGYHNDPKGAGMRERILQI
jgi:hypothetical protein